MEAKWTVVHQILEETGMDTAEKAELLSVYNTLEEKVLRAEFRLGRTMKDKAIIINLLNKTIGDLQAYQTQLEEANKELSEKNREIALQNLQLVKQKKLLEEQSVTMAQNLRKLELSYAELEQFSFVASHDLKSPLRSISSYAQLLRHRYSEQLDEQADSYINFIVSGAGHMDMVLSDLLEYTRVGKEAITRTCDANKLFEIACVQFGLDLSEINIEIQKNPLPEIRGIESALIILFQNLLSNAIKFNQNQLVKIKVSATKVENFWQFCLEDNGIGLDERYADKVYKPFQRLLPKQYEGTGMGLAFCKKVIQLHQGKIWYETSKDLGGTAFYFTIGTTI